MVKRSSIFSKKKKNNNAFKNIEFSVFHKKKTSKEITCELLCVI